MKASTKEILNKYLNISGNRTYKDFAKLYTDAEKLQKGTSGDDYTLLEYVKRKALRGVALCLQYGTIYAVVDEDSIEDIEKAIEGGDLGKLVDHGNTDNEGNSDKYWGREGIDVVFSPNDKSVRKGEKIPYTYKHRDMRYLEDHYSLKAFEFGNWLSQQDRFNYLAGLGLALFDLHKLLGFSPRQIGLKGRLGIAFGARGRGTASAHFEPATFIINLTRYSRPKKVSSRSKSFRRANLIVQDGGVGAFSHEFAHALDFYAGTYIAKGDEGQISGGRSTSVAMRFPSAKMVKIQKLMDDVMNGILWKGKKIHSDYYKRLNKRGTKEYYLRRNEIWARSFEVYVQFKLKKKNYKNVFLNKSKYASRFYLTQTEMKKLEKSYDALMAEYRKLL